MTENAVYTVEGLAERWLCSTDLIYDLLRKKKLKAFRVGSSWRISAKEVDRLENPNEEENA